MKNVDDLIEHAGELTDRGLSKGEIADELNVSRETASWLVERGRSEVGQRAKEVDGKHLDIHVDWSTIGRDSTRLSYIASALANLLQKHGDAIDLTVGIEKAGAPLATMVGHELGTDLCTYTPRKHRWNDGDIEDLGGSFSRNFAQIRARECYVIDDTITSGTTMAEAIEAIRADGGEPVCCAVIVDKRGIDELDGIPVYSLVQVIAVGTA